MSPKMHPGAKFPDVEVPQLGGGTLKLGKARNGHDWQLVIVYRGKHCPICTGYLKDLNAVLPELNEFGIDLVAVSADARDLAAEQIGEVAPDFDVGYDLSIPDMQALGLYITPPNDWMPVERPFAEPGMFVVNETGHVKMIDIANVPFLRPGVEWLVRGLKFVKGQTEPFPVTGSFDV